METDSGKTFALQVEWNDAVDELQIKIQDKEDIPSAQQRLMFNGKELENYKKLSQYSIDDQSTVQLYLREKPFQLLLTLEATNKTININAETTDTIEKLKKNYSFKRL